eukprot:m.126974 g.126974  ORF g.126974 m.126974 type:complete len:373 (+) comp13848_c0_seq1:223-1341(+)
MSLEGHSELFLSSLQKLKTKEGASDNSSFSSVDPQLLHQNMSLTTLGSFEESLSSTTSEHSPQLQLHNRQSSSTFDDDMLSTANSAMARDYAKSLPLGQHKKFMKARRACRVRISRRKSFHNKQHQIKHMEEDKALHRRRLTEQQRQVEALRDRICHYRRLLCHRMPMSGFSLSGDSPHRVPYNVQQSARSQATAVAALPAATSWDSSMTLTFPSSLDTKPQTLFEETVCVTNIPLSSSTCAMVGPTPPIDFPETFFDTTEHAQRLRRGYSSAHQQNYCTSAPQSHNSLADSCHLTCATFGDCDFVQQPQQLQLPWLSFPQTLPTKLPDLSLETQDDPPTHARAGAFCPQELDPGLIQLPEPTCPSPDPTAP